MSSNLTVSFSTEAELDREMSAIIARWVDGKITREQIDRFQQLSLERSRLMNGGGARVLNSMRRKLSAA